MRDQLLAEGSNPQAAHVLDHTFKGEPAPLRVLARELTKLGFTQRGSVDDGMLILSNMCSLSVDEITETLRGLARAARVSYDGWGAMVVR